MGTPLGGEGFATQRSLTPAALSIVQRAIESILQNQQSSLNRQHSSNENRKNRKFQDEQRKKQESFAKKQFWTGKAVDLGTNVAGGAVLGAIPADTSGLAMDADIASTAKDIQTAPVSGTGSTGDFLPVTPDQTASMAQVDVTPQIPSTPAPNFAGGVPRGTKFTFGDSLGGSVAKGAGYGAASFLAPGLTGHALEAPYRNAQLGIAAANTGLRYAQMGHDLAVDESQITRNEAQARAADALARSRDRGVAGNTLDDPTAFSIFTDVNASLDSLPPEAADQRHAMIESTLKNYKFSPDQRRRFVSEWRRRYKYAERLPSGGGNAGLPAGFPIAP